ncbi:cytochrome P450 [Syncephalis fuscata]|nr:cytochrome P450 [Syncephalis fuscata]
MIFDTLLSTETLLVTVAAYVAYSYVVSKTTAPLKNIPGPWYTGVNGFWYNFNLAKGVQLFVAKDLHEEYGPVMRLTPNIVSVADPDALRAILSTHRFKKGAIYDGFKFGNEDNLFSTRKPEFFKTRRRLVAPAFTISAVNEMENIVLDAGVYALAERLEKGVEQKEVLNMFNLFSYMTFDVMGEIMFGKAFGLLQDDSHPILDWIHDTLMLGIYKTALGSISNTSLFNKNRESEKKLIDFALESVQRRQQGSSRADSLQRLLDAYDEETNHKLEDRQIATELVLQIIAGTDTTSAALTCLVQNAACMKKLQQELDEVFPDINAYINHAAVKELPYLNAVCDEGLRLHSIASGDAYRVVPPEGAEICGQFIPGGTTIVPQTYFIHRSEKYWDKAEEFIPERWLTTPENVQAMKQNFMPFSIGVRACVGRSLAWVELRVSLAVIVRRFNLTFVPGANMSPWHRFIIRPKDSMMNVTVQKRTA